MKRLFLSLVFATGFGGAACGQTCMWPAEKSAFEVVGLQNSLMVAALSCQAADSYNRFMGKFQAALADQRGVMDRYFVRSGGLAGRQQEDGFMTRLANDQSAASLARGAAYCPAAAAAFRAVLGLPDAARLTAFASGDDGAELAAMTVCAGTTPGAAGGVGDAPRTVIAAAQDGREEVADAGKAKAPVAVSHARRKAIVKPPARPVTGLVQV